MRYVTPLVVLGLGLILVALGLTKILPGAAGTGGGLMFLGVLLLGLGFIRKPEVKPDAPPPMGPFEEVFGMFYQPAEVFKNLKVHPRWLVAVLLIALASSIYSFCFTSRVTQERIISYTTDKLKNSGFLTEQQVDASRDQQLEAAKLPMTRIGAPIFAFVGMTTLMAFLGAIYMLGSLMFGGRMNFWQGMAIAAHAALPVLLIQKLLSVALLYTKAPEDLHPILNQGTMVQDNLGILFNPAQNPVLFSAGSTIGVLTLYGVWLTATGIKNGADGISSSGAWTISIAIWFLVFLLSVVSGLLFASFIS